MKKLIPLTPPKTQKDFFVFDVETTGLSPQPKNFIFGVIYGRKFKKVVHSVQEFKDIFQSKQLKGKKVFAHNAEYDLSTIYGNIIQDLDRSAVFNGGFIMCKNQNNVTFVDSMNIFPASLAKIGATIGMEKLENEKIAEGELTRENMTNEDINYCIRDCAIVYKALEGIYDESGLQRITIASLSMSVFRMKFMDEPLYYHDLNETFFDSYYGGRTEAFKLGKVDAKVYDLNSLYPSSMEDMIFPDFKNLRKETRVSVSYGILLLNRYEGRMKCFVKHKRTNFGFLPKKMDGKLCFPNGKFWCDVNFYELRFALMHGVVEILKVKEVVYGNPIKTPFKDFVNYYYDKRKVERDGLKKYVYKLYLNSLYGRFAMRKKFENTYFFEIPHERIQHLKDTGEYYELQIFSKDRNDCFLQTENKKMERSYFCIPSISSYITSHARVKLLNSMLENEQHKIVYCDTDSIFLDKNQEFLGSMGNELGQWKLEEKNITEIRGLKNYSYTDENGVLKDAIKGVSKRAKKIAKNSFSTEKYYKTKEALRRKKTTGAIFTQTKVLKNTYTKRKITDNKGNTRPLFLNEKI